MDELRLSQRKRPVHVDEQVPIRRRNIRMTQDEAVSVPGFRYSGSVRRSRIGAIMLRCVGSRCWTTTTAAGMSPGRLDRTWMSAFRPPAEAPVRRRSAL